MSVDTSQLIDLRNGDMEVFDVQIYRVQSILTFTDRLFADRDGDGFDEQLFFTDNLCRTN